MSLQIHAQDLTITGVVKEKGTGEPLPGVNVIVLGTQYGVTTDFDGAYKLRAKIGDTLVFSYPGYFSKKIHIKSTNKIDVVLIDTNPTFTINIDTIPATNNPDIICKIHNRQINIHCETKSAISKRILKKALLDMEMLRNVKKQTQ